MNFSYIKKIIYLLTTLAIEGYNITEEQWKPLYGDKIGIADLIWLKKARLGFSGYEFVDEDTSVVAE